MEETKVCTKCNKELPIEEFYCTLIPATPSRRAYTYVRVPCKKCHKVYQEIKYYKSKGLPNSARIRKAPLPTREEMAEWFAAGCPLEGRRVA